MAVGGEGRSPGVCGITREAEPDGAGLRASSSLLDRVVWDNFFPGGAGEGWGNRAEAHKASTNNICRVGEKSLERKNVRSWHPFFSLVGNFRTESHALERGRQLMGPVLSTLPGSLPLGLACECKVKELNKMVPQPRAGP